MGGQIWPPPLPHGMCWICKTGVGRGVLGGPPKTENVQKNYLGIVKKFQNNGLSHFLMVEVQKFRGQIWPPVRLRASLHGCSNAF